MKHHKIAAALLLLTSILHFYQHFLAPPSQIWLGMMVFGALYLWLAFQANVNSKLRLVRLIPLVGAALAVISVLDGSMKLLPWTLPFILIDLAIAYFATLAINDKEKGSEPRRLVSLPDEDTSQQELKRLVAVQKAAFLTDMTPALETRLNRLSRLADMTSNHGEEIIAAINADYAGRPRQLTELSEVVIVTGAIRHTMPKVRKLMRSKCVSTAMTYLPGRNKLLLQPKGVVGIISPWNYPYQLAIMPAIDALAAGNRVLLKPSETTPQLSHLMKRLVATYFAEDEMAVVIGGLEISKAFAATPFDHLLYTGSTATGRSVAQAAAANLTPVTLELGGKSPAILDLSANMTKVAPSIAFGRLFNSGQTCISPDYVLVHTSQKDAFIAAYQAAVAAQYPSFANNNDYGSIVNARFAARLRGLLEDAKQQGAEIVEINPSNEAANLQKPFPCLVLNAPESALIMQEEIFGPHLPVKTYETLAEAIAYVNAHERPLALYYYGDATNRDVVLANTISGGVTVNDCLWQIAQENQPFGGIGASGQGAYHGEQGFRTFSHERAVFYQSRFNSAALLYPPYGKTFERLLALLKKM